MSRHAVQGKFRKANACRASRGKIGAIRGQYPGTITTITNHMQLNPCGLILWSTFARVPKVCSRQYPLTKSAASMTRRTTLPNSRASWFGNVGGMPAILAHARADNGLSLKYPAVKCFAGSQPSDSQY